MRGTVLARIIKMVILMILTRTVKIWDFDSWTFFSAFGKALPRVELSILTFRLSGADLGGQNCQIDSFDPREVFASWWMGPDNSCLP